MAVSLTCVCGAILEIDDKFRGQQIPCPDCNRLLDTVPPPAPPQATSGWALASLVFSLAGALTLIGPIVGIACGAIGLLKIKRDPKLGGVNIARAGIISGSVFAVVSMWAILGAEFLGADGFLRLYQGVYDLKFPPNLTARSQPLAGDYCVTLKRPSHAWGIASPESKSETTEELVLANLWDDAQIVVFSIHFGEQDKAEDLRREAIDAFLKTNLAKNLARLDEPPPFPPAGNIDVRKEDEKTPQMQDFAVDFGWAPIPRKFLFHVFTTPGKTRINVAVGGARRSRFERLETPLRQALESCQVEDSK